MQLPHPPTVLRQSAYPAEQDGVLQQTTGKAGPKYLGDLLASGREAGPADGVVEALVQEPGSLVPDCFRLGREINEFHPTSWSPEVQRYTASRPVPILPQGVMPARWRVRWDAVLSWPVLAAGM